MSPERSSGGKLGPAEIDPPPDMGALCPQCNATVEPDQTTCQSCASPLQAAPSAGKAGSGKFLGIVFGAVLLLAISGVLMMIVVPRWKANSRANQSIENQRAIAVAYTGYLKDNEGVYPRVAGPAGLGGKMGNLKIEIPEYLAHVQHDPIRLYGARVPIKERPLNAYIGNVKVFHDPADVGGGAYSVPSFWESFGTSYQPQVADDMFRVKRVLGQMTESEDDYEGQSLHEQEITKPENKIIQGDWNWPYDREDAWHGQDGDANHIMLYGDGHVDQFIFPPTTTMTNWMLSPAPDPDFTWW